jgi:hypothetical protein
LTELCAANLRFTLSEAAAGQTVCGVSVVAPDLGKPQKGERDVVAKSKPDVGC